MLKGTLVKFYFHVSTFVLKPCLVFAVIMLLIFAMNTFPEGKETPLSVVMTVAYQGAPFLLLSVLSV